MEKKCFATDMKLIRHFISCGIQGQMIEVISRICTAIWKVEKKCGRLDITNMFDMLIL